MAKLWQGSGGGLHPLVEAYTVPWRHWKQVGCWAYQRLVLITTTNDGHFHYENRNGYTMAMYYNGL